MDDKHGRVEESFALMLAKFDEVIAQMQLTLGYLRNVLPLVAGRPLSEYIAEEEASRRRPPPQFMSGRWRKRDGDVYGVIRQPGVRLTGEAVDADNPTGGVRPPDQRRD
jgi:hypothetical protein